MAWLLNRGKFEVIYNEYGFFLVDSEGFIVEAKDIKALIENAKEKKNYIKNHNYKALKEYVEKEKWNKEYSREKIKSHIYLFESNGAYKIGVSNDVKRRLRELGNQPYKVTMITHSKTISDPYYHETKLHNKYKEKRLNGEWFELSPSQVEEVKNIIENL